MSVYVGDDWSEDHHDVHLMNEQGESLAARRLPEGLEGMTALHELLAEHAQEPAEVVIGIETERGPWVAALLGAGYRVYAINPRAASRYRERHQAGGGKSDSGDARMLANLVRTDRHKHREVAGDSAATSSRAGARPRPAAARLEPHAREQPAPERAAVVLSGRAPRLRRPHAPRCALGARHRPGAARGGAAQHDAAPLCTAPRRPHAQRGAAGCGGSGSAARPHA